MTQKWYKKATVQAAIVSGIVAIIVAFIYIFFNIKNDSKIEIKDSRNAVVQNMEESPGSVQIGGDLNVNTARRIKGKYANKLIQRLKDNPCTITVGVLGMGGEPEALANDFLLIAKQAGCPTKGVYHGIGFEPFNGIQLKYSSNNPPRNTVFSLTQFFKEMRFDYFVVSDPKLEKGSIYLYIGYKL